ncbi:MAG TPA: DEAD/DEAH box helicase family protein [Candidatus Sulfotelmatobacter sp.]|jgi:type I restriction enzyme R subunit|nr:DEAD/DEAH box helicase family protein [Candidatus Sulfotelmatobacter sp.]
MPTEADSRIVIDRKLREAGWNIEDANQVATEEPAADGRADYLLLDSRGRPLAVNEAKRFSKDPTTAKVQAEEYARSLKAPFIFLSNGEVIYFWDYENYSERLVENFFTRGDLERLVALRSQQRPLKTIPIEKKVRFGSDEREVRKYQQECLTKVDTAIESGKRRLLVEMATGTGKTFTVALMLKRLFQAGRVQRVLFLADRIELARQAKEETFDIYLDDYPSVLLTGGRRSREGQITVGTLPTITSQLGAGGFSSGYFDLVITDECHRSIYSSYKHTLLHFDAIHIGLTATPDIGRYAFASDTEKKLIRNTYEFFNCWNPLTDQGNPVFSYGILDGIKDKYLAEYDIYSAKTRITSEGINFEGEDYSPTDLERLISFEDRIQLQVKEFVRIENSRAGNGFRKAIVFACTKRHAAQICRFLNAQYPQWKGKYAEIITTDVADPKTAIRRFKREEMPVIAVSVGMLDTGFDAPRVENLLMMRPTRSAILYQQMRGRGSRICKRPDGSLKNSFLIYDFTDNSERFNDPQFDPTKPPPGTGAVVTKPRGTPPTPPPRPPRADFKIVPVGSVQDSFLERKWIEVGPEGMRVDIRDYQDEWNREVAARGAKDVIIAKIQAGEIPTDEELDQLAAALGGPESFFNETNLREAFSQPDASLLDFIRAALGQYQFPSREQRVDQRFEAWLIQHNFDPEQARVWRILKNQMLTQTYPPANLDLSVFNALPPLKGWGGLRKAMQLFGDGLENLLNELKEDVLK